MPEPDLESLVAMINGFRTTQVVYVLAKLGLAEHLAKSSMTAGQLAARASVNPRNLRRLLRLAAYYGLVTEEPDGKFRLSSQGEPLRGDIDGSVRSLAIMIGEEHYGAWGRLAHAVESGDSAFEHVYGEPFFDYLAAHPDAQATFDAAMGVGTELVGEPMTAAYDFSSLRLLVDVGGGNGSVSAAILRRTPNLKAVIFDRPQVLAAAERHLSTMGVLDRCRLIPGNFFDEVPPGGDLYILANILHDWDDERALRILRNCREAMTPNAAVMLMETVMPEHGNPSRAAVDDVNMMVMLTGKERTEEEYRSLLRAAGLCLSQVIAASEQFSLLTARPR